MLTKTCIYLLFSLCGCVVNFYDILNIISTHRANPPASTLPLLQSALKILKQITNDFRQQLEAQEYPTVQHGWRSSSNDLRRIIYQ